MNFEEEECHQPSVKQPEVVSCNGKAKFKIKWFLQYQFVHGPCTPATCVFHIAWGVVSKSLCTTELVFGVYCSIYMCMKQVQSRQIPVHTLMSVSRWKFLRRKMRKLVLWVKFHGSNHKKVQTNTYLTRTHSMQFCFWNPLYQATKHSFRFLLFSYDCNLLKFSGIKQVWPETYWSLFGIFPWLT